MTDHTTDTQYEEVVLKEVTDSGDYYTLHREDLGCFAVSKEDAPFEPKAGMTARFYGRGFGHVVRGVAIDGTVFFYRTEEEERQRHEEEVAANKKKREEEFESKRDDNNRRIEALPEPFKRRMKRFIERGGDEWRAEFEGYELFCCEEAVKLVDENMDNDGLQKFWDMKWEEQREAIPDLDYNAHSGNTFGMAVRLAVLHNHGPKYVVLAHGAMAALVGCEDFGCHPITDEEEARWTEGL